ncbi:MAG: hypothetical protein SCK57_12480 [Bacillota bacterium]|nr:hypothetical protein [Bacillota bacterium]MDW7678468.1 hypothetical protein [Bacillota bacterium]
MPMTNIIAKVKKIDIANRVLGEDWKQTITLTLGEIELKNENLIAIRQFRPNEEVLVNLKSLQLSLGDLPAEQKGVFLERDTDVTPAPEDRTGQGREFCPGKTPGAGLEQNGMGNAGKAEDAAADYDLSAPVVCEGSPIEVTVFEEGEDDVDPASIVKSYTF